MLEGAVALQPCTKQCNTYILVKLANKGYREALLSDKGFLEGLNVIHGKVTCKEVAESFDLEYVDPAWSYRDVQLMMHESLSVSLFSLRRSANHNAWKKPVRLCRTGFLFP